MLLVSMAYSSFSCLIVPLVSEIFPFFVMVQTRLSFPSTNVVSAWEKMFGSTRK